MADKEFPFSWPDVIIRLFVESPDTVIEIRVDEIPHPRAAGMRRIPSNGEDRRRQFALVLNQALACHVLVCGDWYHARLYVHRSAQLGPSSEPEVLDRDERPSGQQEVHSSYLATLIAENPGTTIGVAALAALLAGAALARKKQRAAAAAAGLGLGAILGLIMVAVETATTSPRTSEVAQALLAMLASAGLSRRPASRIIRLGESSRSSTTAKTASKTKSKAKKKRKASDNSMPF